MRVGADLRVADFGPGRLSERWGELVAPDTVNTAPEKTIDAVRDHGVIRGNTIEGTYAQASSVFSSLEAIGVDLNDVFDVLESEGVEKFIQAWNELLESVSEELAKKKK